MAKLTDIQIRAWIKAGERFEGRSDGHGLYLRYRAGDKVPVWRFRYQYAGKSRVMLIGSYGEMSLAKARETAKELSARVALGFDVAGEKQARKTDALEKMEQEKNALRVSELAAEYFERQIMGRWKHPDILRRRIDKDINPNIGHLKVEDVRPRHIDDMLQKIVSRGAPTIANDVLRWTRRIFDYGIKRHMLEINPTGAFEVADAGGQEKSRERWLTREELIQFFQAMRMAKGFSRENELTMKLILCLCCRKMQLCGAPWAEFDLDGAIWHLPAERAKNGDAIDIPLPPQAVEWLRELHSFSDNSKWVLPARKMQHRMIPHIQESTLPVALAKVRREMPDVPNFTIHDFRRTGRTHLAALGVDPIVAERCLNHRIKGVEGIYIQPDAQRHQSAVNEVLSPGKQITHLHTVGFEYLSHIAQRQAQDVVSKKYLAFCIAPGNVQPRYAGVDYQAVIVTTGGAQRRLTRQHSPESGADRRPCRAVFFMRRPFTPALQHCSYIAHYSALPLQTLIIR